MFRHILPNAAGSLVVATTLSIGGLILLESTLSFLGLGTQPPAASWGNMLTGAQELLQQAPVLALLPGLLIFLTVIAFNFLGDGLAGRARPAQRAALVVRRSPGSSCPCRARSAPRPSPRRNR